MNSKIVLTLILSISSIQVIRASPIDDVIADLTSKVAHAISAIDTILHDSGLLIRSTRRTIGETITGDETEIQGQIDELDNIIVQAEQEAQQSNKDITQCVNSVSAAISSLHFQKFDNCAHIHDLDLLGEAFDDLRTIKRKLSHSIKFCRLNNPIDVEGLKNCVQSDIADAQQKSETIQQKFSSVCVESIQQASSCADAVVEELDTSITKIAHDFKQCLEEIIN